MDNIFSILSTIPDPRHGNHLTYPIDYLLLIMFCAIMSGYTTWADFELYAELHEDDLKELYTRITRRKLKRYTPSHDTFSYACALLNPERFSEAFTAWLSSIFEMTGQHICIDGKTMRGVKKLSPDAEAHSVTAYIAGLRASFNQVYISQKSNEINAIKKLLDLIDLEGNVVTIDAIGTQKEIVKKVVESSGDYILNVKGNQQGTLLEVEDFFSPFYKDKITKIEEVNAGHGRIESRVMESIVEPQRFKEIEQYKDLDKWVALHSIHKMTRTRHNKKDGSESVEISYFISSLSEPDKVFHLIRNHWAIENNLHYCLDVIMGEDKSLRRKGNAAKNVNIIYKMALFFLERLKKKKKKALAAIQKINATKDPSHIVNINYL